MDSIAPPSWQPKPEEDRPERGPAAPFTWEDLMESEWWGDATPEERQGAQTGYYEDYILQHYPNIPLREAHEKHLDKQSEAFSKDVLPGLGPLKHEEIQNEFRNFLKSKDPDFQKIVEKNNLRENPEAEEALKYWIEATDPTLASASQINIAGFRGSALGHMATLAGVPAFLDRAIGGKGDVGFLDLLQEGIESPADIKVMAPGLKLAPKISPPLPSGMSVGSYLPGLEEVTIKKGDKFNLVNFTKIREALGSEAKRNLGDTVAGRLFSERSAELDEALLTLWNDGEGAPILNLLSSADHWSAMFAQAAPSLMVMTVAGIGGVPFMALTMETADAASSLEEFEARMTKELKEFGIEDEFKLSDEEWASLSWTAGITAASLEVLGFRTALGSVMKTFTMKAPMRAALEAAANKGVLAMFATVVGRMGVEGGTEFMQEVIQNMALRLAGDDNNLIEGALGAGMGGIGIGGGMSLVSVPIESIRAGRVLARQKALDQMTATRMQVMSDKGKERRVKAVGTGDPDRIHILATEATPENAPKRKPKETEAEYRERALKIYEAPDELSEAHDTTFDMEEATDVVNTADIAFREDEGSLLEADQGAEDAGIEASLARNGVLSGMAPVDVIKEADGTYTAVDGESVLAAAKRYGWETIPINVVSESKSQAETVSRFIEEEDTARATERVEDVIAAAEPAETRFKVTDKQAKQLQAVEDATIENGELVVPPGEAQKVIDQLREDYGKGGLKTVNNFMKGSMLALANKIENALPETRPVDVTKGQAPDTEGFSVEQRTAYNQARDAGFDHETSYRAATEGAAAAVEYLQLIQPGENEPTKAKKAYKGTKTKRSMIPQVGKPVRGQDLEGNDLKQAKASMLGPANGMTLTKFYNRAGQAARALGAAISDATINLISRADASDTLRALKLGNNAGAATSLLSAELTAKSPKAAEKMVAKLAATLPVLDLGWTKVGKKLVRRLQVRLPVGIVAEVRISPVEGADSKAWDKVGKETPARRAKESASPTSSVRDTDGKGKSPKSTQSSSKTKSRSGEQEPSAKQSAAKEPSTNKTKTKRTATSRKVQGQKPKSEIVSQGGSATNRVVQAISNFMGLDYLDRLPFKLVILESESDLTEAQKKAFGFNQYYELGHPELIDNPELLGQKIEFNTVGFYDGDTDTAYIFADLAQSNPLGVFLHEVGVHQGLEAILGKKKFKEVLDKVEALLTAEGANEAKAAAAEIDPSDYRVLNNIHRRVYLEEVLAHIVEGNIKRPWLVEMLRWVSKRVGKLLHVNPSEFVIDDLVAIVSGATRKMAAVTALTDILIEIEGVDSKGDPVTVTQQADTMYRRLEKRLDILEQLRGCVA